MAHLQPNQLHSTTEVAALLKVTKETLRSRKSRDKANLVENVHWQSLENGTVWTTLGVLLLAERTSTPQAKTVLAETARRWHDQVAAIVPVDPTTQLNTLEAHDIGSLSVEEQQVFVDAIGGKLPEAEVQDLLQQMQSLDSVPDSASEQEESATPQPFVQHRNVKRRSLIAASVIAFLLGGFSVGSIRLNATTSATTSDPALSRAVASQLNPVVADRDSTIDHSLALATQQDAIDRVRRDYLLIQAEHNRKATGISIEKWLIRHLNQQIKALGSSAKYDSGSAQQIAILRSISGETRATLLALQSNKAPVGSYSSTVTSLTRSFRQIVQSQPIKEANR
ncbi:MAG: hypothetical protein MUC48_04975 [Leptolyngbya sp. Prado105]|jgi:hypothetical protein|nr:hypothetical protein [Leptolyngbya sp. Prado105]